MMPHTRFRIRSALDAALGIASGEETAAVGTAAAAHEYAPIAEKRRSEDIGRCLRPEKPLH